VRERGVDALIKMLAAKNRSNDMRQSKTALVIEVRDEAPDRNPTGDAERP